MKQTSPSLDEIVRDLVARAGSPVSGATDAELLGDVVAWERLGRVVDSMRVTLAGELAHRSRPELGHAGLARAENFPTPAKLVAAAFGVSVRAARERLGLGARLRAPEMLGGGSGRVPFPVVTVALRQGRLGLEAGAVITRELAELRARGVAAEEIAAAELTLEHAACSHGSGNSSGRGAAAAAFSVEEVTRLTIRVRDLLDPDGLEPRAQRQEQLRGLTLTRSTDGMFRGRLALTPEQGAIWLTATQAVLSPRVVPRFTSERDFVEHSLTADHRTAPQRLADAATELIARAAGQPEMPRLNGAAPTLNVHVALADLESGRGAAGVDGLDNPLTLSVVDRLRCHADVITTVFGSTGQVLHHGKTRRRFSHAQNRALAARDGGCIWPGCDRPPSWTETHHVRPWRNPQHAPGRTDIDNGVLLCHFHHSHLHTASWTIVMLDGAPHILPPRWLDPDQVPIPTTRRRTVLAADHPTLSPSIPASAPP